MAAGDAVPKQGEPFKYEKGYAYVRVNGETKTYRSVKKMSPKSFEYLLRAKVIDFILTPEGFADRIKRGNFRS